MTNEQTAILLELLVNQLRQALKECEDQLPDEMLTTVRNLLNQDRQFYMPTIPLWRVVEDLEESIKKLEVCE